MNDEQGNVLRIAGLMLAYGALWLIAIFFFFGCSATVGGDRCPDYPLQEWRELEEDVADAWQCLEGDPSKAQNVLFQTDIQCQEGPIETYCLLDGHPVGVWEGAVYCEPPLEGWYVTGRYFPVPKLLVVTTKPFGKALKLHETTAAHEMFHLYLHVEKGDPDHNHHEPGGPWTPEISEAIEKLRKEEAVCLEQ